MTTTKQQIDTFFKSEYFAIAGVSRNEKKFGRKVYDELLRNNYKVVPINPLTKEINGSTCYPSVDELPNHIESLLILTPKVQTDQILKQAINKDIKNIWVQQFSNTNETLRIAQQHNQDIIHSQCIFMYAEPVKGFHKFHRTIVKVFGKLPN